MERYFWIIFPYPDQVLRPIGNRNGLGMDSRSKKMIFHLRRVKEENNAARYSERGYRDSEKIQEI
jgi:hypothetical protein